MESGDKSTNVFIKYHQLHEIENLELLVKLLTNGYDPNAYDFFGLTPLHYCTNPQVAELLIRFGANIFKKSRDNINKSPIEMCENPKVLSVFVKWLFKDMEFNFNQTKNIITHFMQ